MLNVVTWVIALILLVIFGGIPGYCLVHSYYEDWRKRVLRRRELRNRRAEATRFGYGGLVRPGNQEQRSEYLVSMLPGRRLPAGVSGQPGRHHLD